MADQRYALLRLNNQNYQSWKFKMEMLLIRERLWSVISKPMPVPLTDEWLEKDEVARATIGLYVDDNQARLIKGCASAKAVWDKLREYHDKRSVVYLLKKLARLDLPEGGDVEEHIQIFNELVQRTEDAGQEIPDKLRVALMMVSLPTSFDPLVTAIQQRPAAEITFDLVQSSLMAEAEKRRERANEADGGDKALRSNVKRGKGGKSDSNQQQEQQVCNNCHKPGHFWRKCPDLKNSKSTSKKDDAKAKQANVPDGPLAWMAGDGGSAEWIIDSGASRHMTGDRRFFKALHEKTSVTVTLADGKQAEVRGTGSGIIVGVNGEGDPVEIELSDVLFVPKLTSGLISVPTLAAKGFDVVFNGSRCEVRNRAGAVAAQGIRHGSLYRLCTPDQAMITVQKGHTIDCQHTWHRRLGHRDQEMVQAIPGKYAEGITIKDCGVRTVCSCCMEGKMCRTPFPKLAVHDTKEKLDLVHTDLSGPMEPTPSGNRYYLCLIDDYTRMTFVYLLRNKSDAAGKIEDFVQFCKTQVGKTPRIIRSDGGGEYVNKALQGFLRREGIVSQITAPYSPQQNGVAERKNRFLKESTLCMLRDADLEPKYWGEAVLTATYIQNRVPSRSIGMSPFEKWYGKKPSLQHFRIFGSEAWVQVPAQKRKKMEVKAIKLVFVGYSNEHKAYRFVDKQSGRVTISRDVKFVEDLRMPEERECSEIGSDTVKHNSDEEVVPLEPMVRDAASDDDTFEGYESAQDLYFGESDGDDAAGGNESEEELPPTPEPAPGPAPGPVPGPSPQGGQVTRVLPNRSTRGQLPQRLGDYEVGLVVTTQDEPTSYVEAVSGPEKEEAIDKIEREPGYFRVSGSSKQLTDNKEYHSLIGSLLYLSTHTRPDIAASVGILSRKVSGPSQLDWTEARRIVRYLIYTADHQLVLGGAEDFTLVGYSDADWAGDAADRKSCSGYLFRLGGATVTWTSKKQGCVSTSTMEAEYVALSQAAQEAVWLRNLLDDINEKQLGPTVIFEDNRSCLDFAALDQQKKRSKHIDTRYHYTRELCSKNIIVLKYCASEDMIADILTKPLGSTKVRKFTAAMGLVPKQDDGGVQG